jgi:hypothetical protein
MSPVEQIALTVNIALRRDAATLDYYRTGSSPDAFATLPKEWTADQIRSFQDYFDALMSGNLARRRMTKFMPADFKLIETRQPPLKDQYDEWLARIICYAFSVPASAFVSQVNRATSETLRMQATQEGLVPLKSWIKSALDRVIQECMNEPGLEFVWVGDDAVDPLQQAQTLNILVSAGIKTREEARADLGLGAAGGAPGNAPTVGPALGKYNSNHDEQGRFSTADNAAATVGSPKRKPQHTPVQVASNDATMSDATVDGRAVDRPASVLAVPLNSQNRASSPANLELVNHPADYHNQVVNEEIDHYEDTGARCVSEVRLTLNGIDSVLDIFCVSTEGAPIGVEVKTGDDPVLSPNQALVYGHAVLGAGVTSADSKLASLGIPISAPLPAFPIFVVWAPSEGRLKRYFKLSPAPMTKVC